MKKYMILSNESETVLLGSILSKICIEGSIIYLRGPVGSGKTVLCRSFLHALGYIGYIKSPTYTLIESYNLFNKHVYHFDLYRLNSSKELMYMDFRECFNNRSICLIEWPKQELNILPQADFAITLDYYTQEQSRQVIIESFSNFGLMMITEVCTYWENCIYEVKV